MKIGDYINQYRISHDLTMEEFGKRIGKSKGYVSMLESGRNPGTGKPIAPSLETYSSIASATGKTLTELLKMIDSDEKVSLSDDQNVIIDIPSNKIPLLGTIAAGTPILAEQNIEEYIDINSATRADFALRVRGDSMIGAGIFDGDIVFIREQPTVEDGEIAAVMVDEEATLKRVYVFDDRVQLRSENPAINPINLNGDKNVRILGKAVFRLTKV